MMADRTPEEKAADAALTEAIVHRMALTKGDDRDRQLLIDYIVVTETMRPDDDGKGDYEYWDLIYRDGTARTTVSVGLLTKALDILRGLGNNVPAVGENED